MPGATGVVLGLVVGAAAGFFLPDLVVYQLSENRQERIRAFAAAGAVIVVALTGIILFGGGRRRPRRVTSA